MKDYEYKNGSLVVKRVRRVAQDKLTGLPKRYVSGLTPYQKRKYLKEIQETKRYYARTGKVKNRKPVSRSLKAKRSPHAKNFEDRYGFKVTELRKVKAKFSDTDVDMILAKGRAAYASGSRPTATGPGGKDRWAYARLASVLTGGKAIAVDKDLVGKKSLKIIYKTPTKD